ncbi:sulfurase [Tenacibaculum sp. SG-28]|nr:sulfurase [Tenacibaculum sp. SG-28]
MEIIATCIGEQKEILWKGKTITTGIFKFPVKDIIFLGEEEVAGDAICNRKYHGGVLQAVYGYSKEHYSYWKSLYPKLNWNYGMFGENLTISALDETKLHVADTFSVGEAVLEVTKPRQPCMKLGVRFGTMKIVKQFLKETYSGVYFRVVKTGYVNVGDVLQLVKTCSDNPTIAEVFSNKK